MKKDLFTSISQHLNKQSRPYFYAWGFIVTLLVGVLDYETGQEISFSMLYLTPILAAAWFANRNAGIFMSISSALIEFAANSAAGRTYSHPLITIWNSIMLFGFFAVSVFILSMLKAQYEGKIELVSELQNAVEELQRTKNELEQK